MADALCMKGSLHNESKIERKTRKVAACDLASPPPKPIGFVGRFTDAAVGEANITTLGFINAPIAKRARS